jgi:hypothetical protein
VSARSGALPPNFAPKIVNAIAVVWENGKVREVHS